MKLRLLITLALASASVQAMEQALIATTDTPLHVAAKASNYQACFAILTQAIPLPQALPPLDAVETIRRAHNNDAKSHEEQSEEYKAAVLKMSKFTVGLQQQMDRLRVQRAQALRTARNAEGFIPRECIVDITDEKLCELLDPSNNKPFTQPTNPGPLFRPGQSMTIGGQSFTCGEAIRIYDPNK